MSTKNSIDEQLEFLQWTLNRIDTLRASTSSRASMVVSADALFVTGATFVIDKFLSAPTQYTQLAKVIFSVSIGFSLILLAISVFFAANAILFIWKGTQESVNIKQLPKLLFVNPRDTANAFNDMQEIQSRFKRTTKEQMVEYMLGELLMSSKANHARYNALRKSIRFMLFAVIPLITALSTSLLRTP